MYIFIEQHSSGKEVSAVEQCIDASAPPSQRITREDGEERFAHAKTSAVRARAPSTVHMGTGHFGP